MPTHPDHPSRPFGAQGGQATPALVDYSTILGHSPALRHITQLAERIAPTDRTVLIYGPTGAGKEVLARYLHQHSRAHLPFVDLNCGAMPEQLIEAELFGYSKGAFTGAITQRQGLLEAVGEGTLFLDEIGELPLSLQPTLLRVLETRTFRPVGSNANQSFKGRIVAATHRDLKQMVQERLFREDLYYRLSIFELELPALEQRRDDIPALARFFASKQPRQLDFTQDALRFLSQQTWPGNVRQLRNLIDRIAVLSDQPSISTDCLRQFFLPAPGPSPLSNHGELAEALLKLKGDDKLAAAGQLLIEYALDRCQGNKSAAAQLLGVNRKVVERRSKHKASDLASARQHLEQATQLADQGNYRAALPILAMGITQLGSQLDQDDVRELAFELYRQQGIAYNAIEGWLSFHATDSHQQALAIGQGIGSPYEQAKMQFSVWVSHLMMLNLQQARATAHDMLVHAQASGNPMLLDEAHVAMANTLFWLGDCTETHACLVRAKLPGLHAEPHLGTHGFDLANLAITLKGLAAFNLGQFAEAQQAQRNLESRAALPQSSVFNQVVALQGAAWLACLFEDHPRLGQLADQLASLSQQHGFSFYLGVSLIFRGCALAASDRLEQAEQTILDGYYNHMKQNGGWLFHSFQAWQRGKGLLKAGKYHECLQLISKALEVALEHQERAYLCELMHIKACTLLAMGKHDDAEQELRGALSTAQALGSVPASLQLTCELAHLLVATGRHMSARELLAFALRHHPQDDFHPVLSRAYALFTTLSTDATHHLNNQEGIIYGI